MGKQVITEVDVVAAAAAGSKIIKAPLGECILTPRGQRQSPFFGNGDQ